MCVEVCVCVCVCLSKKESPNPARLPIPRILRQRCFSVSKGCEVNQRHDGPCGDSVVEATLPSRIPDERSRARTAATGPWTRTPNWSIVVDASQADSGHPPQPSTLEIQACMPASHIDSRVAAEPSKNVPRGFHAGFHASQGSILADSSVMVLTRSWSGTKASGPWDTDQRMVPRYRDVIADMARGCLLCLLEERGEGGNA